MFYPAYVVFFIFFTFRAFFEKIAEPIIAKPERKMYA